MKLASPFRLNGFSRLCLASGIVATSTLLSLVSPAWSPSVSAALQDSPKVMLDEAWQIVNREYVDPSFNQQNWLDVRQELLSRNYTSHAEAYQTLVRMLNRLDDPYTRFMTPDEYQALSVQTSGEVSGIGVRLQVDRPTQQLIVVEVLENSPAQDAGIQEGDRVLEIDGQSTVGMSVDDASALIRGEVGTDIEIRISRNGLFEQRYTIARAQIEVPNVFSAVKQEGRNRVGYIRLNEFSAHAAEQMEAAIATLSEQQVDGFVLDLRGNPGGLLRASIDISRMWIDRGTIVQTVYRDGVSEDALATGTALTDLPLTVLVDHHSASSSEILTGALMDNRRATVVGSQTFGKALVQSVYGLSDGSGLAVTVAHYYTPAGTDISSTGITPHVEIDLTGRERRQLASQPELMGTAADPQYTRAVLALNDAIIANRPMPNAQQRPVSGSSTQIAGSADSLPAGQN